MVAGLVWCDVSSVHPLNHVVCRGVSVGSRCRLTTPFYRSSGLTSQVFTCNAPGLSVKFWPQSAILPRFPRVLVRRAVCIVWGDDWVF